MTETTAPPPPAPDRGPQPPRGARPRAPFARSSADKVLGGIAGAIGARLDVEPVIVRIVLVVVAIAGGGLVVPLYLLTWAVVARDDDPSPRLFEHVAVRDGGVVMWIIAALLALALVEGLTSPFDGPSATFPLLPLALIGIGVALWTRGDRGASAAGGTWPRRTPPPPTAWSTTHASHPGPSSEAPTGSTTVPTDTTTAPHAPTAPHGPTGDAGWPPTADHPAPVASPPPAPREPRERSVLGPLTIALALIAAGVAAALDAAPALALDLGATGVTTVALLVLGLGLVVGSVWGRARWLLAVALLLMPFVGLGLVVREVDDGFGIDVDAGSGVGERFVVPVGDQPLPDDLDLLAGSIEVDLTEWEPDAEQLAALEGPSTDLSIDVGAGEVQLTMPADIAWRVRTDIGLGEYQVRGPGVSLDRDVTSVEPDSTADQVAGEFVREGGAADGPVLDVTVDVALGQVTIRESAPTTTGPDDTTTTDTEELS